MKAHRLLAGVLPRLSLGGIVLVCALSPATAADAPSAFVALPEGGLSSVHLAQDQGADYGEVIDALDRNGYRIVSVSTTLLNRVVIRARNPEHLREVVFSRASGRILRDGIVKYYVSSRKAPPKPIEEILTSTPQGIKVIEQ